MDGGPVRYPQDLRVRNRPLHVRILFGAGIGLLSYVLEVFGEHTLGTGAILGLLALSLVLLAGTFRHAIVAAYPLLRLLLLGAMTVLSALVFRELKPGDSDRVSHHETGDATE